MKLILNLLTVPIKVVLVLPILILTLIAFLAGYDDESDAIAEILSSKWFD